MSWLHDDFKPANLILTANGAVGIDLPLCYTGAVVDDLAPFLLELHLMCLEPATCRLLRTRADMERSFLSGYSGCSTFPFRLGLAWSMLQIALCIYAARSAPHKRTARDWYLRKRLQLILPGLIRELQNL